MGNGVWGEGLGTVSSPTTRLRKHAWELGFGKRTELVKLGMEDSL